MQQYLDEENRLYFEKILNTQLLDLDHFVLTKYGHRSFLSFFILKHSVFIFS